MSGIMRAQLFGAAGLAALFAVATPTNAQEAATTSESSEQTVSSGSDQSIATQANPLLVSVNGTEIRQSDLLAAMSALPPQMQQLPQEMIVGLAIDQLVARQLILEAAREQELANDPEVQGLVEPMISQLTDQAMVQVWLQRELDGQVTDENLQQAFSGFQTANPESEASLEEVRPQLLQALQQEALSGITEQLRSEADIVFYDAAGNPAVATPSDPEPSTDSGSETPSEAEPQTEDAD